MATKSTRAFKKTERWRGQMEPGALAVVRETFGRMGPAVLGACRAKAINDFVPASP
jgi:hypothetical protein